MLRLRLCLIASLVATPLLSTPSAHAQANAATSDAERLALHQSSEWVNLSEHLPNPDTATVAQLETAGDVLRARRFPEDALDYYGYALARGGKVSTLLNKMGVVRLELGQYNIALQLFQRVVHEDKRNAVAWNNLGAALFMYGRYHEALADYHKASSLDKKNASFHANLGLTYFELGSMDDMRGQFAQALALNPHILLDQGNGGGDSAHMVASGNYPKLCFEMARLYARNRNLPAMRLWLARASEAGFDVVGEMRADPLLSIYTKDPEIVMILHNANSLRKRNVAVVKHTPSLGPDTEAGGPPASPQDSGTVPSSRLL
jgi:Flp pilus assembly protein TadD